MANIDACIDFVIDANSSYVGANNNESVGPITVNSNIIRDQFTNKITSYPNTFIGNGIVVDNVINAPGGSSIGGGLGTKIYIQNNAIYNAYDGILARNHQYQQVRDENNTINLMYQPTVLSTPTQQYGISHDHDIYVSLAGHYNDIYKNSVTGFSSGFSTGTQPQFEPKKGIWSRYCTAHWDVCNNVNAAGRGFEFEGGHTNISWWLNTMSNCGEAFTLANSGIIGDQQPIPSCGGCTVPDAQDNVWPSGSNFIETMCEGGSNAGNSILYVQSTSSPYKPSLNSSQSGGFPYNAASLLAANAPNSYNCTSSPPPALRISGANARMSDNQRSLLEKIAMDSISYSIYPTENKLLNKGMVYSLLLQDSSLVDSSTILHNFYTSCSGGNFGLTAKIENAVRTHNYGLANTLISKFVPSGTIEQNQIHFYQIYMRAQQGTWTSSDSTDLETLAASCPMLSGTAVFQARAFHNSFYNRFKHYNDNCPRNSGGNREIISAQSGDGKSFISLYPNPTTGVVYVAGDDSENHYYHAEVYDLGGKLILSQELSLENGVGKFKLEAETGAYPLYLSGNESKGRGAYKIMISK